MFWRVFFTLLGLTAVTAMRCNKFYRKDYTYIDQLDAFYKLHWDQPGDWQSAFLSCDDEGATFFYPKTTEERTVVKRLVAMELKTNVTDIFVGIHDEFGFGEFMTVDEYTYHSGVKKCYKINQRKKSWADAMKTCIMEGGVLAVAKNSDEGAIIYKKMEEHFDEAYFVGFRRLQPQSDFYTVKGQNWDDTFYKRWWGSLSGINDMTSDCGVVGKKSGLFALVVSTRNCTRLAPFVCEMMPVA